MPTILELIKLSTDYLEKKGIDQPRLNAELLLADVLKCKRMNLYLSFDKPLQEPEIQKYREHIRRRAIFEPLQYIIGSVEFFGMDFTINKSVLIPRPETELIAEKVLECSKNISSPKILDIGTGSGNIAIAVANSNSDVSVTAVDISADALNVARENRAKYSLDNSIELICSDIKNLNSTFTNMFDIIVSNPPYVSSDEYSTLQKEIINYEPKIAVTDFGDGFSFYREIAAKSISLLKNSKGFLFFEMALGQSDEIKKIMNENDFSNVEVYNDLSGIPRVIKGELI